MNEIIATYLPTITLVVGALAFLVSVITEVTKNITWLKKIPTDIEVFVLSIVFSLLAFFGYAGVTKLAIEWYMVVGTVVCGFIVAFVAMFGWEKISELWKRFMDKKEG